MALREGSPLPEATPGPLLDRLLYHDAKMNDNRKAIDDEDSGSDDAHHNKVQGASIGPMKFTFDLLKDERFGTYATAVLALSSILSNLDRLEAGVKELVGEVKFNGYTALRTRDFVPEEV